MTAEDSLSAGQLNVLMIGLGDQVITGGGDTRERHFEYASFVNHLHMVVYSPRAHDLHISKLGDSLTVYPSRSRHPLLFIPDAYRISKSICNAHRIDLITTQDPFTTGLVGTWIKRQRHIPLHVQSHSTFIKNPHWIQEHPLRNTVLTWVGRWVLPQADVLRVVNRAEKEAYIKMGLPGQKITVAPVPPRLNRFLEDIPREEQLLLRQRLGLSPEASVILWVGNPAPVKDLLTLFRAFQQLHRSFPDAHLILVGDFSGQSVLNRYVARMSLDPYVHFVGLVEHDDLPLYYQMATIYAHSSKYEGLGLVMVEAAASRKPVVSTATAGAREVVQDGVTGLLCRIGDSGDLAEKLAKLVGDPARAREMGEAGRRYVMEQFNHDALVGAIIESWRKTAQMGPAI